MEQYEFKAKISSQILHGLRGIADFKRDEILLEFEEDLPPFSGPDIGIKECRIPYKIIHKMVFSKHFFHTKCILYSGSFLIQNNLPGKKKAKIVLNFKKDINQDTARLLERISFSEHGHGITRKEEG